MAEFSFPYDIAVRDFEVGGRIYQIECLRDLDATIDAHFREYERTGRAELFEELCPYFGNPWPAGLALADFVAEQSSDLGKARVLEIGCGLAIPSLVLAAANVGARCWDLHPDAAIFLQRNAEKNHLMIPRFENRDWRSGAEGDFDLILASDVLYDRAQAPTLLDFLQHLAPGGCAWIADPGRPYLETFLREAKAGGWKIAEESRRGVLIACLQRE